MHKFHMKRPQVEDSVYHMTPQKKDVIALKKYFFIRNCIVDTDVVNDVTCTRHSGITRVVIRFL